MLRLTACASASILEDSDKGLGGAGRPAFCDKSMRKLVFLAAAVFLLGACSSVQTGLSEAVDPAESTNRQIFDFNLTIDSMALRPTAERYQTYVPQRLRNGVRNALDNLHAPVVIANDVLQGQPKRAGQMTGRFLVNSTLGLGGLLDMSTRMGLEGHDEDFGQTLAVWGVGEGPYLMLPLLGPTCPRDVVGRTVDLALDPTMYIRIKRHIMWVGVREYITILDTRSRNLESLDDIERNSMDFYATVRSIFLQHRASEIRNGIPGP
jgi:phospholipid-binding lipoprotein MlaA